VSHEFDTGLAIPLRQQLLNGTLAALHPLLRSEGGYVAAIKHCSVAVKGAHDEANIGLLWDILQGRTPAIAVSLGDGDYDAAGIGGYRYSETVAVHVYVLLNSLRSRESRQTGDVVSAADDHADPGLFVMHEHIAQLLIGAIFNPPPLKTQTNYLKDMRPQRFEELDSDNAKMLWQFVFSAQLSRDINPDRDVRQLLNEIHTYGRIAAMPIGVAIEANSEMDSP